jgi:hypothetical protein
LKIQTPIAPNVHRKLILAEAFVPLRQPEMSQTQRAWVLAHGHQPSKTKFDQNARGKFIVLFRTDKPRERITSHFTAG